MFLKDKLTSNSVDFIPEFNTTSDFKSLSTEYQKLLRDIMVILTIRRGSILYDPENGGNLYEFIWDSMTDNTVESIREVVTSSLQKSSYINLKNVEVKRSQDDNKLIIINIDIIAGPDTILKVALNLTPLGQISVESASEIISKYIVD